MSDAMMRIINGECHHCYGKSHFYWVLHSFIRMLIVNIICASMPIVIIAESWYAKCCYAVYSYTDCCLAECHCDLYS
jgi:hypothetical protein